MALKSCTLKLIDLVTIFKLVTDNFQGFKQQLEAEHEGWIKMSENLTQTKVMLVNLCLWHGIKNFMDCGYNSHRIGISLFLKSLNRPTA